MLQFSIEFFIFAMLFVNSRQCHRGERLSYDPPVNLSSYRYKAK